MVGVVFVFVSEDACEAEALADAFDSAGYSITGTHAIGDALSIVVWSRAALRSSPFRSAAERALSSGTAIVASLIAPPDPARVLGAPVVDLSAWEGDEGDALEPLFDVVREMLEPASPSVIALPALEYEDAEFVEHVEHPAPVLSQAERVERAMHAWEAPIPTEMLHPPRRAAPREEAHDEALELADIVRAAPERAPKPRQAPRRTTEAELIAEGMARIAAELAHPAPDEPPKRPKVHPPATKVSAAPQVERPVPGQAQHAAAAEQPKRKPGVANPRHDYRRAPPPRGRASHAPAAIAFLFVVMVGVSAYTTRLNMPAEPAPFAPPQDGTMSLTAASAGAAELQDFAPEERPPLFEPRPYAEPASAPVRRTSRARRATAQPAADLSSYAAYVPQAEAGEIAAAAASDDSVWQVPELIPAAIVAELERASSAASDAATAVTDAASAVTQPLAELSGN